MFSNFFFQKIVPFTRQYKKYDGGRQAAHNMARALNAE
jgi:hypothetical protein